MDALDAELARYQVATAAATDTRDKAERALAELTAERCAFEKARAVETEALDIAKGARHEALPRQPLSHRLQEPSPLNLRLTLTAVAWDGCVCLSPRQRSTRSA